MKRTAATLLLLFVAAGCSESRNYRSGSGGGEAERGDGDGKTTTNPADALPSAEKKNIDEKFLAFVDSAKGSTAGQLPTIVSHDVLTATMELAEQYGTKDEGVGEEFGRCFIATSNPKVIDEITNPAGLIIVKGSGISIAYSEELKKPEECAQPFQDAMGDRFQINLSQFYTSFFSYRYN
jgi:hypothetical protein